MRRGTETCMPQGCGDGRSHRNCEIERNQNFQKRFSASLIGLASPPPQGLGIRGVQASTHWSCGRVVGRPVGVSATLEWRDGTCQATTRKKHQPAHGTPAKQGGKTSPRLSVGKAGDHDDAIDGKGAAPSLLAAISRAVSQGGKLPGAAGQPLFGGGANGFSQR